MLHLHPGAKSLSLGTKQGASLSSPGVRSSHEGQSACTIPKKHSHPENLHRVTMEGNGCLWARTCKLYVLAVGTLQKRMSFRLHALEQVRIQPRLKWPQGAGSWTRLLRTLLQSLSSSPLLSSACFCLWVRFSENVGVLCVFSEVYVQQGERWE